jgi:hypothetical protein
MSTSGTNHIWQRVPLQRAVVPTNEKLTVNPPYVPRDEKLTGYRANWQGVRAEHSRRPLQRAPQRHAAEQIPGV